MVVVPVECCGVWTKFVSARDKQRLTMNGVVVTPVFKLLPYAWANFKNVVWGCCYVAKIEQAMDVTPE
jgi:hypothetical protein